jgi:hypothetical protein
MAPWLDSCVVVAAVGVTSPVELSIRADNTSFYTCHASNSTCCANVCCAVLCHAMVCCAEMVTCVDVCGMNVMTASLDGSIALWDLRVSDAHNTITTIKAAGNESVRRAAFWEGLWGC